MPAINRALHDEICEVFLTAMRKNVDDEFDKYVDVDADPAVPFPTQGPGLAGLKKIFAEARAAFPDAVWTLEYQVVEGDTQLIRFRAGGTHSGEFIGIPPRGNKVDLPALLILRVNKEGKVDRFEMFMDGLVLTSQMLGKDPMELIKD